MGSAEQSQSWERQGMDLTCRQAAWLRNCIDANRQSVYGRHYRFGRFRNVADYRANTPLVTYDDLEPWILRMAHGEYDVLFAGQPVAFELTGGSTGGRKLVPYSPSSLTDFARAIAPWMSATMQRYAVLDGVAYWSISPAARALQTTPGGLPVGLPDTAYLDAASQQALVRTSAVPFWIGGIIDIEVWLLATLYALVCQPELRLISVWSPTFLALLLDSLESCQDALREVLRHGEVIDGHRLEANRAARVRYDSYLESRDMRRLWPRLGVVSCWTDASSRPYYRQLRSRIPQVHFEPKGLLLTEGVVTVPVPDGRRLLAADSAFFEFIADNGDVLLAGELDAGACYEVVMTTAGGLYRYRCGDRVRCVGVSAQGPDLRFIGRASVTSDLVGEKLTEAFVEQCLQGIAGFRMLVPDTGPPGYVLVIDASSDVNRSRLAADVERALCRNPQYEYARRLGQLVPLRIHEAVTPMQCYLMHMAANGRRLGDVKVPALGVEPRWKVWFGEVDA